MICAPITLFVYNRLDHTRRTVDSLKRNILAKDSDLIIFSDASKSEDQSKKVDDVRRYIYQIVGFKSITIFEREINYGLAKSIIDGVTSVVNKYGRIIVLEDDIETSPYFLTYMNEALDKYLHNNRVISIHGYVYPVKKYLPETFFLLGADCWGWATWKRGWDLFNPNGQYLLDELIRQKLTHKFDYNGTYPLFKMLKGQILGKNDSWAIRWFASAFLEKKLTLYPGKSLVNNIGNDSSGTHCSTSSSFDVLLAEKKIQLEDIPVKVSRQAEAAFESYFNELQSISLRKIFYKLIKLIKSV
jgi:hypothetical protein